MALGYAWFDSYDSVGYVVTLHISPHTVCPYLPIAKRAFLLYRRIFFTIDYEGVIIKTTIERDTRGTKSCHRRIMRWNSPRLSRSFSFSLTKHNTIVSRRVH